MLQVVARDGEAVLVADGEVGASLLPNGQFLVLPVASLIAQGDWRPASEPLPDLPAALMAQVAELQAKWVAS